MGMKEVKPPTAHCCRPGHPMVHSSVSMERKISPLPFPPPPFLCFPHRAKWARDLALWKLIQEERRVVPGATSAVCGFATLIHRQPQRC